MKIKYAAAALAALSLSMSSCDDFLDTLPDNRTDLDTPEKVTKILVSAYPTVNWNLITEYYSDNTDDNSDRYQMYDRLSEEIYKWEDTRETGDDSPLTLWNTCYSAVAAANQALQAIDRLGNGEDLQAQRGEALLCRAYGHFMLSYVFCNAWTESGKDTDMGIPYSMEPETTVRPQYDRETIGKTYEHIAADLEEGLPLIDDNNYDVPKYHFNRKAAYAFAARFYLYYGKYDKAIECANVVLGEDPALVLRDWGAIGKLSLNDDLQPNAYIDAAEPANLLLVTSRSWWGLYNGPLTVTCRYTHNVTIANNETCLSTGVWGPCNTTLRMQAANYTSVPKVMFRKYPMFYFEVVDPAAGTGYYNIVQSAFNTDETLLVRAEAYTMKKDYARALADMQAWQNAFTTSDVQLTTEAVNDFYGPIEYYTPEEPTVKKELHPDFAIEEGTQENMLHFILHARRITTLHEGLRWGDIKRYGITVYRRTVDNRIITVTDTMLPDDPRRAVQLPNDVIQAGLPANPRNN